MRTRTQVYKLGLAAAVAAHNLKLLSEKKSRPVAAIWDMADRAKHPVVKRELEAIAYVAQRGKSGQASKTKLRAAVRHFRAKATQARHELAEYETRGGARASQLKQIRGLSAWIRRSAPRAKAAKK